MGYGKVLREKIPAIRFLVDAQKTVWYPILFAAICIISGSFDRFVYIPLIAVLCVFVLFSVLFADDNKVFLVPVLMIYYSLGRDNTSAKPGIGDDLLTSSFHPAGFTFIVVCGVVVTLAFVSRLIADGSIAAAFKKRRTATVGILALDVALMLNGAFSPTYTPMNLLYGFIIAAAFTLFYFACSGMLSSSEDFIPYACKSMVCASYVALGQFTVLLIKLQSSGLLCKLDENGNFLQFNRHRFVLAWGLSTAIGGVFVLGIAAALYLARNGKRSVWSYLSAVPLWIGTIVINTRSAMLIGAVAFAIGAVLCCLKGENKRNVVRCRIMLAIVVGIALTGILIILTDKSMMQMLLEALRLRGFDDSARLKLWVKGWNNFLSHPIFGAGFDTGSNISNNVFSSMYHSFVIQFPGSMGIVGIAAALIHFFTVGKICFKRPSADKLILMLIPFMILGMSLVDNFFFYPFFQIFYCVFLCLAEYHDEERIAIP